MEASDIIIRTSRDNDQFSYIVQLTVDTAPSSTLFKVWQLATVGGEWMQSNTYLHPTH